MCISKADSHPLATRGLVELVNTVQMAVAKAYIKGLEVPDSVVRSLFETYMPIFFCYFTALQAYMNVY